MHPEPERRPRHAVVVRLRVRVRHVISPLPTSVASPQAPSHPSTARARADAEAGQKAADERELARQELLGAVTAAQEGERARVSLDIDDDIGQALTSVLLGLRLVDTPRDTAVIGTPAIDDTRRQIDELHDLVADALRRTRRLSSELRSSLLESPSI